jgi:glycosyltransferase involved in cell wall biosynthesis
MRIVYVLTTLAVGGTERQVLAIAGRMAERGHSVALLVLKPRMPDDLGTPLEVVSLDIQETLPSMVAGFRRGVAFLRVFRPDVIHSHNFHGNMLARMMRLFYRDARLISTIHNVYEGGRLRMLAYRWTDGLVDRTTAVSNAVAERFTDLKAVARQKCIVIPNGIETAEFVPDPQRRAAMRAQMGVGDEFVWLCVARHAAGKDIPNLIGAIGLVWQSDRRIELWMAGPDTDAVARRRAMYAVSIIPADALDCFRRLGPRRDIPALLDAADGFVLASAWEGMPLALGEAMAMEKPVVATDVGGVRELVGQAGVLVPPRDSDALAKAMLEMMHRTSDDRAGMGRAARERMMNTFNMEAKVQEWEALYRSVAK